MPVNKRESVVFTIIMCGIMVFVMSVYNISIHRGLGMESIKIAWVGFPIAYIVAICADLFIVSKIAKGIAFKIIKENDPTIKKVLVISGLMVCGMVIIMSFFGAAEQGIDKDIFKRWIFNIPVNFIMALPLQFLVAGPVVRFLFKKIYP